MALARAHLSSPSGRRASWRELASACQVSVSTMNHYFKSRGDLIAAIIEHAEQEGAPYLVMASKPSGPFPASIAQLVAAISYGFDHGVLALQVIGLGEGFADRSVSSAFLGHHLEPVLEAIAARLNAHIEAGEMLPTDTHYAAITLLSPLLVAHLHQTALGGRVDYPLSLPDFITHHVDGFVKAHAAPLADA